MAALALPDGRPGRLLAAALAVLAMAFAWFAVAAPLLDWHAERAARIAQRGVLAGRMAALAASLPQLRQAADAQGQAPSAAALLDGATDAIAAAGLQERVQAMAGRVGATLASVETLPPAPAGAYRRIGLHVTFGAPWPVLVRLLEQVAQATPPMLVDDLALHGARMVSPPPDPPLDAGFTVFAFRAPASAPGK